MKLKKIASLMLAGIMAVSMLAACGNTTTNDDPASSEPTTSSSVTESVLSKTSEAIRNKMTVNTDDKLDKGIAYAAENNVYATAVTAPTALLKNGAFYKDANKFMDLKDEFYNDNLGSGWDFTYKTSGATKGIDKDCTYWAMGVIDAGHTDEWIMNYIAGELDKLADVLDDGSNIKYTVRVAIADCKTNTVQESKVGDTVIFGVAITSDVLKDNH